MRKQLLASVILTSVMVVPALAHGHGDVCRPYAIVMQCDADMPSCGRPHMVYAPGQGPADHPAGNYFFMTPQQWHRHRHRDADDWHHHAMAAMRCQHFHAWWPAG